MIDRVMEKVYHPSIHPSIQASTLLMSSPNVRNDGRRKEKRSPIHALGLWASKEFHAAALA